MNFIFVSHAAPDKLARVKPLVQALALEGVTLWLDRPGSGEHDFQLPEDFIRNHGMRRLRNGVSWAGGIVEALRESSAVLICLSRAAIEPGREVLRQEIFAAVLGDKAVSCVVDDLDLQQVPGDWGLVRPGHMQSQRVDVVALAGAVAWLEANPGFRPEALPAEWRSAWQTVRHLRDDLDAAARRGIEPALGARSVRLASLLDLLGGRVLPPAQLQRIYRRSLPDAAREQRAASMAGLLADLDDSRPRSPLLPSPLVEFAERVGRETADVSLLDWVQSQTRAEPGMCDELRRLLNAEDRAAAALATLFVDVDPDEERQVRWWVHAPNPDACMREEVVALGDGALDAVLAACISEALARADEVVGHRFRLRVALLLPHSLMVQGIESLPITFDDGFDLDPVREPLCRRYPITLHWRARTIVRKPGRALNAWNRALAALDTRLHSGGGANVLWSDIGGATLPTTTARLFDPAEIGVCIGLSPHSTANKDIEACLREGVPCFFWFRAPPADADALRSVVCEEFARHRPSEAPTRVGLLSMTSPGGGPFAALSVVWDEPGHLPPAEMFASPQENTSP